MSTHSIEATSFAMSSSSLDNSAGQTEIVEGRVLELVGNYTAMEILHPIVAEMSKDRNFKRMFWRVLGHEYEVINQRSQVLADYEITAAQKAFKTLVDNEDEIGAVEIYCDEILGLTAKTDNEKAQMMANTLQTRDHIMNTIEFYGTKLPPNYETASDDFTLLPTSLTQHRSVSSNDDPASASREHHDESQSASDGSEDDLSRTNANLDNIVSTPVNPASNFHIPGQDDAKMNRLFEMYSKAKAEFHASAPKSLQCTSNAKFLRDTTENCLSYIAFLQQSAGGKSRDIITAMTDVSFNGIAMSELKATLKETTEIAEKGSGGKKRRFDESAEEKTQKSGKAKSKGEAVVPPGGRVKKGNAGPHAVARPIENRAPPPVDYRGRRNNRAGQNRRVSPPNPYASPNNGQSQPRVIPHMEDKSDDRNARAGPGYRDCYRPSYR